MRFLGKGFLSYTGSKTSDQGKAGITKLTLLYYNSVKLLEMLCAHACVEGPLREITTADDRLRGTCSSPTDERCCSRDRGQIAAWPAEHTR